MNYHNILHDDMRNGIGLRVTLFVSGCNNKCIGCQNPQTWDTNSGIPFDSQAKEEIFDYLNRPYINGITLSGGDPLHSHNINDIYNLCKEIKSIYPDKTIWLYTGYEIKDICFIKHNVTITDIEIEKNLRYAVLQYVDVLVDGKFIQELANVNYHWAGSTNQRVIDIQKTLAANEIVLYEQ